jgi:hypothetical protein
MVSKYLYSDFDEIEIIYSLNQEDVNKFNPNHDEKGQFSSGPGGSGSAVDDLINFDPAAPISESPRNAGGMTAKAWEAWEHGPDGQNFIELFRKYACQELGLEVPKTPFDQGGYLNYMMDRGWGAPNRNEVKGMLDAIANGKSQPALYRGMTETGDTHLDGLLNNFLSMKPGETLDMPLVSTTRSLGVASWYAADMAGQNGKSVIMKIQPGAKGVALKAENSWYPQDHEVITSGKFKVVSVEKVSVPYWKRSIFEPRFYPGTKEFPDHYEVATYDGTKFSPIEAKTAYNAFKSGNLKSIESPTRKFVQDRKGGNYSMWNQQPPKEFTVVEVQMVEPHVVKKGVKKDHQNSFFELFNMPSFIVDSLDDVEKFNPNHDEVGRFAPGNGGVSGASTLPAAYEGFTLSGDETSTLNKYLGNGYKDMNSALRGTGQGSGADTVTPASTQLDIETLDALIERAPIVQSEAPIYRVFNAYNVTSLKPGETYVDKGFMSTTLADISAKRGKGLREHLGNIDSTMDVVARIKPNGHHSGLSVNHADKDLAAFPKEQEFILPRGTQLKYLGFETASSGETIMNFERMNG